jgi:hypothetical protein
MDPILLGKCICMGKCICAGAVFTLLAYNVHRFLHKNNEKIEKEWEPVETNLV